MGRPDLNRDAPSFMAALFSTEIVYPSLIRFGDTASVIPVLYNLYPRSGKDMIQKYVIINPIIPATLRPFVPTGRDEG